MTRRVRRAIAALGSAAMLLAAPPIARAACPFPTFNSPDLGYPLNEPNHYTMFSASAPYWIAIGVLASDPADDYDIGVYRLAGGAPEPQCFSDPLASSSLAAGRTDFVVGDFNYNSFASYYAWTHCYSGHCDNQPRGLRTWRSGGLLTVGDPPIERTVPSTNNPPYQDQVISIFDVWLVSGTTYHFAFQRTGDKDSKLLLFRNPGGVKWTGRGGAEFEVTECTSYAATTTGYHGVVVVHDRRSGNIGTFTLGVAAQPICNCATLLAPNAPQSIPPWVAHGYDIVTQPRNYWQAAAVRSSSDWDLSVGATSEGTIGCLDNTLASSVFPASATDVVAGDFNLSSTLPDTFALHVARYSGLDGATVEMDRGEDLIYPNGPRVVGTMGPSSLVRIWDAPTDPNTPLTFVLDAGGPAIKALVFRNPMSGISWQGRGSAVLETAGSGTYTTSPTPDMLGVALVHDTPTFDNYSLSYGWCSPTVALENRQVESSSFTGYYTFQQPAGRWAAIAIHSPNADWDLEQYDQAAGEPWPKCFGSPGALSNGSAAPDVIVGDFRFNPPGAQYVRAYQFSANAVAAHFAQWDAGDAELFVNAPPTVVSMPSGSPFASRLWCHQVYLVAGITYTFEFGRTGTADTRLLVFRNPSNGVYWAPRTAAELTLTSDQPYLAPSTGLYGLVVVKDNNGTGTFSLRVSNAMVSVEPGGTTPVVDALHALGPNPSTGRLRLDFALARAGTAWFELVDTQGRVVSRRAPAPFDAGGHETAWDARADAGGRLTAGVYWVRMRLGDRTVGKRKVTVLP